jgi:hypothetical protein
MFELASQKRDPRQTEEAISWYKGQICKFMGYFIDIYRSSLGYMIFQGYSVDI